jgi:SAM-dependent methyltransferase
MAKRKAKKFEQKLKVDIGCGFNKQPGFIGMDKRDVDGVDIVHDIENFPWPLDDESCDIIMMSHIVEHIQPRFQIEMINECWRISAVGGRLAISTPHGRSFGYLQDPTHCAPWVEATVEYFVPGAPLYEVYRPKPWVIDNSEQYGVKRALFNWDTRGNMEFVLIKITEQEGENLRNGKKRQS